MSTSKVNISQERDRVNQDIAPLHHPSFIPDPTVAISNPPFWRNTILRQISLLTFVLSCLPDVEYFRRLLACTELPNLWKAITSISFPYFYQFAGIRDNRTSNPYIDVCNGLIHLEKLSLTFHTAGLTTSVWKEKDRIALENQGLLEKSKELRVMRASEVIAHYKLEDVFELKVLSVLELILINSELVGHFVKVGSVLTPLKDLQDYFKEGFSRQGRKVQVDMILLPVPYTG
ncbi:uncharacterized protein N0V89_007407 [Didymosphaeria variabile]|uniref:Uncharacterized protein n=1 Tax=Didymosphaeria variabile TaxID=1932322 RepID=A0A9W9CAS2_9PLEO|nr:uncharacterized protein N0V89_007407 [Didymosphaeria variabile]KAJ4352061.1 hypothetical protein N0V89_007407 [Didymosphaeria variabile]